MANGIPQFRPVADPITQAIGAYQAVRQAQAKRALTQAQAAQQQALASQAPSEIALRQAQAAGIPAKTALNAAQARKTIQDINMVNKVGNANMPPVMRAYNLYLYNEKTFGENDPKTIAAKNNYDQMKAMNDTKIKYENTIAQTLPFRNLSSAGKQTAENLYVSQGGVLPGPLGPLTSTGQRQTTQGAAPSQQPVAGSNFVQQMNDLIDSIPDWHPSQQPIQSTKHAPTIIRNAVLGTGDTPQHTAEIAPADETTPINTHPNRLIHPAPASGDINAQQKALLGQYSPAGVAQQKEAGKHTQEYVDGLNKTSKSAISSLDILNQYEANYKNIKGISRGPGSDYITLKGTPLSPAAQAALKNGNQLILSELSSLKGAGARLNREILRRIAKGTVNYQLSPEAERIVADELRAKYQKQIHQARLASTVLGAHPSLRTEPQTIEGIVNRASEDYSPIDEKGKIHLEMFDEWPNYATPKAIEAFRSGQDYLPEDVKDTGKTLKQFRAVSRATHIPVGILIKRYRVYLHAKKTGGVR